MKLRPIYCATLLVHLFVIISLPEGVCSTSLQDSTDRRIKAIRVQDFSTEAESLSKPEADQLQKRDTIPPINERLDSASQDVTHTEPASLPRSRSGLEDMLSYQAEDSIEFHFDQQQITLHKQAEVSYQETKLEAAEIDVFFPIQEVEARPMVDSTGHTSNEPVFTEGNASYLAQHIRYNFGTRRALIKGVITQQGEAYVHGNRVKVAADQSTYVDRAQYTTCSYKRPHFHFRANRIKLIPGSKTLSAPFHLRVGNTPLPIGFPFGFFARPERKSSGVLTPRYGEERARGFFLRNIGYYFAISPYMDLSVRGDLYTKGSFNAQALWRYIKRYSYTGNMNLRYAYVQSGLSSTRREYWINWQHSPQSRRDSRFSASVDAGSSSYNTINYQNNNVNTRTRFSSNITYSKNFTGTPFSLNTSLRHQQNVEQKVVELSVPEFSWNMRSVYPLRKWVRKQRSPLRKLSIAHSMQLRNEVSNAPQFGMEQLPFSWTNLPIFFRRARNGVRHQVPIAMPLNVLRYFTMTPSFSYTEVWYPRELRHSYDENTSTIRTDTLRMFSRAGYWALSNGISTRIYGTFLFKERWGLKAIRHVLIPRVGLSYRPDFSKPRYDVHTTIETPSGARNLSKYDGFIFGSTPRSSAASMNMQLSNQLEMKIRSAIDSIEQYRKVTLLDNLSFSSSYNFLSDSFALSPIQIAARTSLFKRAVVVSGNATLDPYVWQSQQDNWVRIHQYAWQGGQGLGTLSTLNANLSLSLKPPKKEQKERGNNDTFSEEEQRAQAYIFNHPEEYVDFSIPWNLRINYGINQRRIGRDKPRTTQSMSLSGGVKITPSLHLSFSSGYDLESHRITQTSLSFVKDLHCWEIIGNWIPFGRFTSYDVTIRAKSLLLQGLKLSRRQSFFDTLNPF